MAALTTSFDLLAAPMFVNGDVYFAKSGNFFDVVNPATEQLLARVAAAEAQDVDVAVASAKACFNSASWKAQTGTASVGSFLSVSGRTLCLSFHIKE